LPCGKRRGRYHIICGNARRRYRARGSLGLGAYALAAGRYVRKNNPDPLNLVAG